MMNCSGIEGVKRTQEEEEEEEREISRYREIIQAIEKGDNKAKTELAWYKLSGCGGVEVDEEGAIALLTERVKDDDPEAMWMLGICYEYGIGVDQDIERAEMLYRESKKSGNKIGKYFHSWNGERGCGVMNCL